jgi:hypothetical protein
MWIYTSTQAYAFKHRLNFTFVTIENSNYMPFSSLRIQLGTRTYHSFAHWSGDTMCRSCSQCPVVALRALLKLLATGVVH